MMPAMTRPPVPHPRAGALEEARRLLLDPGRCPGCGARLAGTRCDGCGLGLAGPAGAAVWEASRAAAAALAHQADVVGAVRRSATAPAAARVTAGAPATTPVGPVGPPPPPPRPSTPPPSVPRPAPAVGPAPYAPPGASTPPPARQPARQPWPVQTVLVALGAALLAVASLVFLVFTWELLTLGARAAVIALGTAAVLALAVVLRRRGLRVSAEAVAALGSVLLTLDVWALWATGLLGGAPGWLVGGVGLAACGGLLALYGAHTGLRAGTVAAAVLVPVAPLPAVLDARTAAGAMGGLLLAFAATSTRHLPAVRARVAERRVLATGAVALAVPLVVVPVVALARTDDVGPTAALVVLAVVAVAAFAVQSAVTRAAAAGAWAGGAGLLAVATAAVAVAPVTEATVPWSAPGAAAVAVLAALAALVAPPAVRSRTDVASAVAAVAAAASALPEVVLLALAATAAVLEPGGDDFAWAAGAVVTTASSVLVAAAVGLRLAPVVRHVAAALACVAVLEGVALLVGSPPQAVGAFAAVTLAALVVPLPSPWRRHTRTLAVLASAAAVVASATGVAADATTAERVALTVALAVGTGVALVAASWGGRSARGAGTGVAAVLATAAVATALRLAGAGARDAALLAAAALGLTVVALVLPRLVSRPRRIVLLPTAAAVQSVTWLVATAAAVDARPAGADLRPALPLVALPLAAAVQCLALALLGRGRVGPATRRVATGLVVPAAATVVLTAHLATGRPAAGTTSLVACVLACAGALVARAVGGAARGLRSALEVSGAVVAGLALAAAPAAGVVTLELVLLAVTAGVVALAPDRRALRWWALGLAVVASWAGLAARDVGLPEAYAAPLGLVLAGIGVARLRRSAAPPQPDGAELSRQRSASAVSFLTAGVLLVGVPPALVSDSLTVGSAHLDRTALLTGGLVLLAAAAWWLAGSRVPASRSAATALAGCVGLLAVLGPVRRAATAVADGSGGEAWGPAAAAVLGLATLAANRAGAPRTSVLAGAWTALLVAALPTLVVAGTAAGTTAADGVEPFAVARLAAVAVVGTALALVGVRRDRPVLVGQGLTLLGLATLTGVVSAGPLPLDAVLGVAGVLAGAVGAARLAHDPAARSWPALGVPCGLVLVPALVGLQAAPTPWRWTVVLVGGVAAVLVGAARRLQAPFVVGAAVLAAEVALQLVAAGASVVSHVGWWPLLFAGGVVLTVVGMTYERRLRDAREATRFVARLR